MLHDVDCVLFDAVGTLIYPSPSVGQAYAAAGRRFGSQLTPDEATRRFHAAWRRRERGSQLGGPTSEVEERAFWRGVVAEVFHDLSTDSLDDLFAALWQHFAEPEHWRLYEDAAAVLRSLVRSEIAWGVASNFDSRLRSVLAGLAVLPHAALPHERLFISSEVGFRKPDRRFFSAVAGALELPAERLLLVGDDRRRDFEGARSAGWRALLVDRSAATSRGGVLASLSDLLAVR